MARSPRRTSTLPEGRAAELLADDPDISADFGAAWITARKHQPARDRAYQGAINEVYPRPIARLATNSVMLIGCGNH